MLLYKPDIIKSYGAMFGISQRQSKREIDRFCKFVKKSLIDGDSVHLKNFGTFGVKKMGEKTLKSPSTQKLVEHKSYTRPTFHYSRNFKNIIKRKHDI